MLIFKLICAVFMYISPLGDAVLPLMLMALAYLGVRVFRARKRA